MWHTKSCWLTLEATVFASLIRSDGSEVISAALRPEKQKKGHRLFKNTNKAALSLPLYHSACLQSILAGAGTCIPHYQCQSPCCVCAGPPCAGSPRWDKESPADTVRESVSQIEWTPISKNKHVSNRLTKQTLQQYNRKASELSCFHFNWGSGWTNGKLGSCFVPWG